MARSPRSGSASNHTVRPRRLATCQREGGVEANGSATRGPSPGVSGGYCTGSALRQVTRVLPGAEPRTQAGRVVQVRHEQIDQPARAGADDAGLRELFMQHVNNSPRPLGERRCGDAAGPAAERGGRGRPAGPRPSAAHRSRRSTARPAASRRPGAFDLAPRPKPRPVLAQTHALGDQHVQPKALGQRQRPPAPRRHRPPARDQTAPFTASSRSCTTRVPAALPGSRPPPLRSRVLGHSRSSPPHIVHQPRPCRVGGPWSVPGSVWRLLHRERPTGGHTCAPGGGATGRPARPTRPDMHSEGPPPAGPRQANNP